MTLLAPVSAIIGAALCIPALLSLYFLKLRRRPMRVSSTLFWQDLTKDVQVNVPLRVIRPSWLLFLHLLILSLFLLALGRPAVDMPGAGAARIVIVIDRSASMSARIGESNGPPHRTRLDEAKERAIRAVDRHAAASGAARFAVISLAGAARALTPFTSDRAAVKAAIRAVEPTDQPGRLKDAADLIRAAAADEADESGAARATLALIFTDGAFADASDARFGNAEVRFEIVGSATGVDNAAIVAISARRDYDDPARVRLFARAINAGTAAVRVPVALTLDGRVVERHTVELPAAIAEDAAPLRPGEATFTLEFDNISGGAAIVTLGREDMLAADNAAGVVLDPPASPRLVLVIPVGEPSPRAEPGNPVGPSALIHDVLAEMPLRDLRVIDAAAYESLAAARRCDADAIIFDRVTPAAAPLCPTLSWGAPIPVAGGVLRAQPGGAARALAWKREHPVMRGVSLDAIFVANSLALEVFPPGEGIERARVEELATGSQGPLILLAEDTGVRRLIVSFGVADSTWPATFGFPIFLSNAVEYLTLAGDARAGRMVTTGEPARIAARPGGGTLVLTGPRRVEVASPASPDGTTVIPPLEAAGAYRVSGGGSGPAATLAVNLLDALESSLAVVAEPAAAASAAAGATEHGRGRREVWHWFVIAAAVLLAVEWLVSAAFLRS